MQEPWEPPGPVDLLVTLGQLIGVPAILLTVVLVINVLSDWIRFGHGAARLGVTAAGFIGDAAARRVRHASPTIVLVGRTSLALSAQVSWVLLLYLGCRMVANIALAFDAGSTGGGWDRYLFQVVSFPTEDPPWTGWVALAAIGALAALNFSLGFRLSINAWVASMLVLASMPVGMLAVIVFGLGGGFVCAVALIFMIIGGLASGEAAAATWPWVVTWFLVAVIGITGSGVFALARLSVDLTKAALWPEEKNAP